MNINDFRSPGRQNSQMNALYNMGQEGGFNSNLFGEEPRRDLGSVRRGGLMGGRMGGLIDSMQGGAPGSPSGDQMANKYGRKLLGQAMKEYRPVNAPERPRPMGPPMRGPFG